jgi:hypothetical protein
VTIFPWVVVVRPGHLGGTLARLGMWALALMLLLPAALARLPASWVALAGSQTWLVRVALAASALLLVRGVASVVYAFLPWASILLGRTLVVSRRGRRHRLELDRIVEVRVEVRAPPRGEVIVVVTDDGELHEVCPLHWGGAGRLWAALARGRRRGDQRGLAPRSRASAR